MAVKAPKAPGKTTKKSAAAGKPKFSKETYIKWYKDMLLIRKFEEKTGQLYIQQKFGGFCHEKRFFRKFKSASKMCFNNGRISWEFVTTQS